MIPLKFHVQQRFKPCPKPLGFSLPELIVGAAMVGIAILMSGVGLTSMLSSSRVVNESNERQLELNRALNFISSEIRESTSINKGSTPDANFQATIDASVDVDPATVRPIIWLEVGDRDIVYYVGKPRSDTSPWRQPQVVYRWGPRIQADGTFDVTTNDHNVLIDSLQDQPSDGNSPTCPTNWDRSPADDTVSQSVGFYACIAPGNRIASLSQVGRVDKTSEQFASMTHESQSYSRASNSVLPPPISSTPPPTELDPGGVIIPRDSEVQLRPRGGSITCGKGGPVIPTETYVMWNIPGRSEEMELIPSSGIVRVVPAETRLKFMGKRLPMSVNSCSLPEYLVNSQIHNRTQVLTLKKGDLLPKYIPFNNQPSIRSFVNEYMDENDRIAIEPNQVILLFELGEESSPNPTDAYDFQDIVLLADIEPRSRS